MAECFDGGSSVGTGVVHTTSGNDIGPELGPEPGLGLEPERMPMLAMKPGAYLVTVWAIGCIWLEEVY